MDEIKELYDKYFKDVYKYLLYLTKDKEVAEDIMQDTFYRAILGISTFKNESSIKTWLFSIARNTWFQKLKHDKRYESASNLELYKSKICLENDLIIKEKLNQIKEIVNTKDEMTRKVFYLRCDGMSFLEIAKKLSISEVSARVIFCRLKKVIKEKMEVQDEQN